MQCFGTDKTYELLVIILFVSGLKTWQLFNCKNHWINVWSINSSRVQLTINLNDEIVFIFNTNTSKFPLRCWLRYFQNFYNTFLFFAEDTPVVWVLLIIVLEVFSSFDFHERAFKNLSLDLIEIDGRHSMRVCGKFISFSTFKHYTYSTFIIIKLSLRAFTLITSSDGAYCAKVATAKSFNHWS